MSGLVMTLEEDKIFLRLAALLSEQFCRFANEDANEMFFEVRSVTQSTVARKLSHGKRKRQGETNLTRG